MNAREHFSRPTGQIGMYLHRGGVWIPQAGRLSDDAELLNHWEDHNLIVYTASNLMAQRMAPGAAVNTNGGDFIANGLQYLAVGLGQLDSAGNQTWNLQDPPSEQLTQTQLYGELTRQQFTSWTFLDSSNNPIQTATNILQLVTTFMETQAVGALVEMGIFGGNATSTANTGILFNYKTFPVWNKPSSARLTVTWNLTY